METLATYAKSAGKSEAEYIKQLYGSNMTVKIFKGILKDTIIASHYQQDYIDSLQYTDEELQKYYEENKNSFDVANYEMITFKGRRRLHQGRRRQHRSAHRGGERRRPAEGQGRRRRRAGDRQVRHPAREGRQGI